MSATAFTLDDLTVEFSKEDYRPQRREPKLQTWYEWNISSASIKMSDKNFLQVNCEAQALDSDGNQMFKKYLNIAVPVSVGQNTAPTYAKGLWLMQVTPLFPEHVAYDAVEKDEITGKYVYLKNGEQLKGKAYDDAITAQNEAIGAMAKEVAVEWIRDGDGAVIEPFLGKRFFAQLKKDASGKYTNIDRMYCIAPKDAEVCYDKKIALGG
ncbi:MAG TPA: hypothetical protein VLN58_12710 [Verrucomicrobiae bacterium]|nr:hypothetical protein [Verrucomicrobiae bacterium]